MHKNPELTASAKRTAAYVMVKSRRLPFLIYEFRQGYCLSDVY